MKTKDKKKTGKTAKAKTKITAKKVSAPKTVAKSKKITKSETPKKKTVARKKVSTGVPKKVKEKAKKTTKTLKAKTSVKKPEKKSLSKPASTKAQKTIKIKILTETAAKKTAVKTSSGVFSKSIKAVRKEIIKPVKLEKTPLKIFLPEENKPSDIVQDILCHGLSEEYGEDELFIMAVDPDYVFASWEITENTISKEKGSLNIRVYDVTGIKPSRKKYDRYFDIRIHNRIGSDFFEIKMHGRDVVMEIGFVTPTGKFKSIMRSNRVSVPELLKFDKLGIVKKLYDAGIPVGY